MQRGTTAYPEISADVLDMQTLSEACNRPEAGAVLVFTGNVRNHSHGKDVLYLEYEAHESMAAKTIRTILAEARERWSLHAVLCVHRVGRLEIGEAAVAVVSAASHRDEAYAANRYVIDEVKRRAPIWKREHFADGSAQWTAACDH